MTLNLRDKSLIWHPFTQEKTASLPIVIQRGQGAYLYDEHNNAYLDLISSWWVNLHGHGESTISKAIYNQALTLEHVIFAGFTHEPAIELCSLIKSHLPPSLGRFFFSDNGSTSVEVALKMAYQYWFNSRQLKKDGAEKRPLFLSFEGGYHGDTFGAMAVGATSSFYDPFKPLLFEVFHIPFPFTWQEDPHLAEKEANALRVLDDTLETKGDQIAAFIFEPLIQGASGMRTCRPEFIQRVIQKVRQYGILVIYDEVMTGWGRTGTLFALEQLQDVPDFLCLSKGITGGFLPLALTITTEQIFQAFYQDQWAYAFAHGHSYTANPLACAAAVASFKLLISENTQKAIKEIHQAHKQGVDHLKKLIPVQKLRILGTIAAFDLSKKQFPDLSVLKTAFASQGLLLRPLGQTIYLLPPYCITTAELEKAYEKIALVLQEIKK